jgi:hypothetical protein
MLEEQEKSPDRRRKAMTQAKVFRCFRSAILLGLLAAIVGCSGSPGGSRYWQIKTDYQAADGTRFVEAFWYDSVQPRIAAYQGGTPDDPKISENDGSGWEVKGNFEQGAELTMDQQGLVTKETFHGDGSLSVVLSGTLSTTAVGTWKVVAKKANQP